MAASAAAAKKFEGPDRRRLPASDRRNFSCCYNHSGMAEKISGLEERMSALESEGYLSTAAYYWTTGTLVAILIAVLSASVYATFQASEALREVRTAQVTLSVQIGYLQRDIDAIKKKMP